MSFKVLALHTSEGSLTAFNVKLRAVQFLYSYLILKGENHYFKIKNKTSLFIMECNANFTQSLWKKIGLEGNSVPKMVSCGPWVWGRDTHNVPPTGGLLGSLGQSIPFLRLHLSWCPWEP